MAGFFLGGGEECFGPVRFGLQATAPGGLSGGAAAAAAFKAAGANRRTTALGVLLSGAGSC